MVATDPMLSMLRVPQAKVRLLTLQAAAILGPEDTQMPRKRVEAVAEPSVASRDEAGAVAVCSEAKEAAVGPAAEAAAPRDPGVGAALADLRRQVDAVSATLA